MLYDNSETPKLEIKWNNEKSSCNSENERCTGVEYSDSQERKISSVLAVWISGELSWARMYDYLEENKIKYNPAILEEEYRTLAMLMLFRDYNSQNAANYWTKQELSQLYKKQMLAKQSPKVPIYDKEEKAIRAANDYLRSRIDVLVDAGLVKREVNSKSAQYSATDLLIGWFNIYMVNGPFGDFIT